MAYVGLYTQQRENNLRSIILLVSFPVILLGCVYAFLAIMCSVNSADGVIDWDEVNYNALSTVPWVIGIVAVWFIIAYFTNTSMIRSATGARPLQRRENPRVYNIVENLCIAGNMPMPKINVIDDPMLNAFASGIDNGSYTVTVTTGICQRLNDKELEGVIAHELTHIRNRDTRVLIISIIFVGIMSTVMQLALRLVMNTFMGGGSRRSSSNNKNSGAGIIVVFLIALVVAALGYFFTLMARFAISRKREYMADAGGAELCGNPLGLASALRKISGNEGLNNVEREDVAQLFIARPRALKSGFMESITGLFSTHPPIEKRIAFLEQV
ncbi:MAG: M48 family metallopeptidase [Bacteroidaceae bacterium]|nr:M48 family metallopeptidase [Bacteroidaceae bacterium]